MTTTPQVTEKEAQALRDRLFKVCPHNTQEPLTLEAIYCDDCLASELAAARREGEIAEHKHLCDDCEPERPCERLKQLEEGL